MNNTKATTAKAAEQSKTTGNGTSNGTATSATPSANVTDEVRALKEAAKESIEMKIARVQDLHDTVERLEVLKETQKDLKSFRTGSGNLTTTLTLRDANGKEFRTSNSEAISLLVESLKEILNRKIKETEAQIVF